MADHHTHDNSYHIDIAEPKIPTWAKIFAPLVALAVLAIQYCSFSQLVN